MNFIIYVFYKVYLCRPIVIYIGIHDIKTISLNRHFKTINVIHAAVPTRLEEAQNQSRDQISVVKLFF